MPLKLAVKMAERKKGGATQPAALGGSSHQSGSGAPQPAALNSTLQTLVDHMRVFITDQLGVGNANFECFSYVRGRLPLQHAMV